MNIGILGAGAVGQSFARAVLPLGHSVMLSSRNPHTAEMRQLAADLGAPIGTVTETVAHGELLALALRWDAVPEVVVQGDWARKVVLDMTNRFGGASGQSAAQELAGLVLGAQVVKALNTIGAEHYRQPVIGSQAATMLMAGDSTSAKETVSALLTQMGFDVLDAGDLAAARHLEALAGLWVHLAMRTPLGRNFAFKILR